MMTTCVYRDVNWSNVFNDSVDKYKIKTSLSTKYPIFEKCITECEKNKTKNYINIEVHQSKLIETGYFSGKETVIKRIQMAIDEIMKKTNKIVTTTTIKPTGIENNVGKNTLMQNDDVVTTTTIKPTGIENNVGKNTLMQNDDVVTTTTIKPTGIENNVGKNTLMQNDDVVTTTTIKPTGIENNVGKNTLMQNDDVVTTTTIKPTGIENNVGKNTLMQNDDDIFEILLQVHVKEWNVMVGERNIPESIDLMDDYCEKVKTAMSDRYSGFRETVENCTLGSNIMFMNASTVKLLESGYLGYVYNVIRRFHWAVTDVSTFKRKDIAVVKMVLQVENVDNSRNKENSIEYLHFLDTYCDAINETLSTRFPGFSDCFNQCAVRKSKNFIHIVVSHKKLLEKGYFSKPETVIKRIQMAFDKVIEETKENHAMRHLPASAESNEPIVVNEKDLKQ
ncbi:Egg protein [Schistosoma japonicum]|nr:Egg protein [Schistosoma japonicum]